MTLGASFCRRRVLLRFGVPCEVDPGLTSDYRVVVRGDVCGSLPLQSLAHCLPACPGFSFRRPPVARSSGTCIPHAYQLGFNF